MGKSALALLGQRRFLPLFGVQFLGATNDNVLRNAAVALVVFGAIGADDAPRGLMVQALLGLFILPFLIFSASAGRLADNCPDRRAALRAIKLAEIGTMALAAIGLLADSYPLLLAAVATAGLQSAYFGPFKYALLPTLLGRDELVLGNGLFSASTYLAILLGIFWGTDLGASGTADWLVIAILLGMAVAGYAATYALPAMPGPEGASWAAAWSWNVPADALANLRALARDRRAMLLVGFISWFWASGSIITAQLPVYVRDVTGHGHYAYMLALLAICLGIACGSLLVAWVLRGRVSTRLVPVGLVIAAVPLFFLPTWPEAAAVVADGQLRGVAEFWRAPQAAGVLGSLFLASLGMGFYVVPMYACLQVVAGEGQRGSFIASNNIFNALLIVAGVLVASSFIAAHGSLGVAIDRLFMTLGLCSLLLAALAWRVLPRDYAG